MKMGKYPAGINDIEFGGTLRIDGKKVPFYVQLGNGVNIAHRETNTEMPQGQKIKILAALANGNPTDDISVKIPEEYAGQIAETCRDVLETQYGCRLDRS